MQTLWVSEGSPLWILAKTPTHCGFGKDSIGCGSHDTQSIGCGSNDTQSVGCGSHDTQDNLVLMHVTSTFNF